VTVRFIAALDDVTPYKPGAPIELVMRRYGLAEVVKLASNEFPLPPFDEVKAVITASLDDLNRYPDGHCTDLRADLARHYGRRPEEIAVGNGTCELLVLLGAALLEPGDEVVFAQPSFLMYRNICLCHGAVARAVPAVEFEHDLDAMAAAVGPRTKMVIICNPNNPTGTYLPAAAIEAFVRRVPPDVLVVLDEAYNEFVTAADSQGSLTVQAAHDNVMVLRTFSKIYGLCGLRVGLGVCSPQVRAALDKVRQPFNVNRLAQLAAQEALRHQDQVAARSRENARLRDYLVTSLAQRGRATVPSEANFMLVDMRGLSHPHDDVCEVLMSMGAIVRDGNALGCPGWARVSVGTQDEIDFFLAKLDALQAGSAGGEAVVGGRRQ
jgi:histidinol-phosphate aminotransferase